MLVRISCPVCGSADYHELHRTSDWGDMTLVECQRCSLVFVNPRPTNLDKYYLPAYYTSFEMDAPKSKISHLRSWWYNLRKVDRITRGIPLGRVLDLGCGTGSLLLALREMGWEIYGVEPTKSAADEARQRLGGSIYNQGLVDCHFPDGHFDLVILWHVLEHLPEPKYELAEIKRILKRDGCLFLAIPNVDTPWVRLFRQNWYEWDVPRHLCHYSPETLERLLHEVGFYIQTLKKPFYFFGLRSAPCCSALVALARMFRLSKSWRDGDFTDNRLLYYLLLGILGLPLLTCQALLTLCGQGDVIEAYCKKIG